MDEAATDDLETGPARRRLSVQAYHRMVEAGIFGADERVELVEGDLIDMPPIGQEHAAAVSRLAEALVVACAGRAIVWPQNPIRLNEANEPQPDLAVLRRRNDFYARGERPGAGDVLLVVEAYSAPAGDGYERMVEYRAGDRVRFAMAAEIVVGLGIFP